jgi:hypothetical protein
LDANWIFLKADTGMLGIRTSKMSMICVDVDMYMMRFTCVILFHFFAKRSYPILRFDSSYKPSCCILLYTLIVDVNLSKHSRSPHQ